MSCHNGSLSGGTVRRFVVAPDDFGHQPVSDPLSYGFRRRDVIRILRKGVGDTFTAALIDGLIHAGLTGASRREQLRQIDSDTLKQVLRRSTSAGAITVSRRGANPPNTLQLGEGQTESLGLADQSHT